MTKFYLFYNGKPFSGQISLSSIPRKGEYLRYRKVSYIVHCVFYDFDLEEIMVEVKKDNYFDC